MTALALFSYCIFVSFNVKSTEPKTKRKPNCIANYGMMTVTSVGGFYFHISSNNTDQDEMLK